MFKIYIDFKSPASYLALKPALTLLDKHQITAQWLPYRTTQEVIPQWRPDETTGDTHRRVRAISRQKTHLLYAKLHHIPMQFPTVAGHTDLSLAALSFIQGDPVEFVQAAFDAYWRDNADLNSNDIVSTLLSRVNLDISNWDPLVEMQKLDGILKNAEEAGIVEAPGFVVDDQIFIGREHLPWIEYIVEASDET